jgi:branched-subunit amino acid transport protein
MVFVVDKVVLGQVFLQVLRFSPVSIIPLMLHTHLHLHTKEANKQANAWEPSKKAKQYIKEHGQKSKFFLG